MKGNYNTLLKTLLGVEGGISDRPLKADPGGLTNKGVTQGAYDRWRTGQGLPTRSVRSLTVAEYTKLYKTDFWDMVRGDELPAGLDCAMFDYCVNSGPKQPAVDLQRVLGVPVDGVIGPTTMGALREADISATINTLCDLRLKFMRGLKNWKDNKTGWPRRVAHIREVSLGMVDGQPIPEVPAPVAEADVAKALPQEQAKLKTATGSGLGVGGCGIAGQTIMQGVQQVQPHVGDTVLGRLAMAAVVMMMIVGGALIGFGYLKQISEAGGFKGYIGGLFNVRA